MMTTLRTLLVPATLMLGITVARADVITVGSGGAFPDVASAVAAAVDGDVILVSSGTPASGFTIDGKAVSVVVDAGAGVWFESPVIVRNLGVGQSVLLHGLSLVQVYGGSALKLENNAGAVRVQSTQAQSASGSFTPADWYGLEVIGCADVALTDCSFRGRGGIPIEFWGNLAEPAVHATSSTLSFFDCSLIGGKGSSGSYINGSPTAGRPGSVGFQGQDVVLYARGSSFRGGDGGTGLDGGGPPPQCTTTSFDYPTAGGNGGTGLVIGGAASSGMLIASRVEGGAGGSGGSTQCGFQAASGAPGVPLEDPGGVLTLQAGSLRALKVPPPAREGTTLVLDFRGPPGDVVTLSLGSGPGYQFHPQLGGPLLVSPPVARRLSLTIGASGFLSVPIPVPDLGAGVESSLEHVQAIFRDPSGASWVASPPVLVLLDQSF